MSEHYQVLIVGGGNAGLSVAARLANLDTPPSIAVIEPSDTHDYQPIWTLVGAGVFPRTISRQAEADYIPPGVTWIKQPAAGFDPDSHTVTTADGTAVGYDCLVVAAGIQTNWTAIPGLAESVGKPGTGVCSNYGYDTVESTWTSIRRFAGGTAIFTQPATPIKCPGAPQKIAYLAEDYFQKSGVRSRSKVIFASAGAGIFAVPKYARSLNKVIERRSIETLFRHDLIELRPDKKQAVFAQLGGGEDVVLDYDMIHVTPPQGSPDFIKNSPLANDGGWVDVDKHTLQHVRYPNVFSLGDCSSVPTSKTGAAIRKQAPIVVQHVLAQLAGGPLSGRYQGYTACPLVTVFGSLILAEFDYDKNPAESFPFDQSEERYSMYALKAYGLPRMYWHGILRGRA